MNDAPSPPLVDLPSADTLGVTRIVHVAEASSTMDIAHELAGQGSPAGVLVVADRQRQGRGRGGKVWQSAPGAGIWMTLIERPGDQRVVGVLALRLGLALAKALTPFVDIAPTVKWPNDVFVGAGKVSGVLIEARWRDAAVDWVAIGIGINLVVPPEFPHAAALRPGTRVADVLHVVIPALRYAASRQGTLTAEERAEWDHFDIARGRKVCAPCAGTVRGIDNDGALLIETESNQPWRAVHAGSLVFDTPETVC